MNPTIKALVSVVLMTATAACATQPTCSGKEMIAMKATGFDEDRIESMCTARRLDINAIT